MSGLWRVQMVVNTREYTMEVQAAKVKWQQHSVSFLTEEGAVLQSLPTGNIVSVSPMFVVPDIDVLQGE